MLNLAAKVVAVMRSSKDLAHLFFHDLKQYNATNFRTIEKADLSKGDAVVHKAFSSVVTRYFIFGERHPEISDTEKRVLFYKLKIDMIARYFSNYPDVELDELRAFQLELQNYVKEVRGELDGHSETIVQNIQLEAATKM